MQVTVNHKTLTKALDTPSSRVVLGTMPNFAKLMLVILVPWCTWLVLIFSSAIDLTIFIGILAGAVGFFYLLAGWKSRLILDLTHYTYLHEFGLPPLMKRRQGHLDAFSHLSLTRQIVACANSSFSIWYLALIPRADAPATEPIVLTFAGGRDQTATVTVALSHRLAEHVALPLRNECTYNW